MLPVYARNSSGFSSGFTQSARPGGAVLKCQALIVALPTVSMPGTRTHTCCR